MEPHGVLQDFTENRRQVRDATDAAEPHPRFCLLLYESLCAVSE